MIKVKHLLDEIEPDDGQRIWIENVGLTRDLREWCRVDHVLPHLGPPKQLSEWFEQHAEGYEYFRSCYHEWLGRSPYKPALQQLACASMRENITLLHSGEDCQHNTGVALHEFLSELEAYCSGE